MLSSACHHCFVSRYYSLSSIDFSSVSVSPIFVSSLFDLFQPLSDEDLFVE